MTEQTQEQSGQVIAWSVNDAHIAKIKEELGEVDAYKDLDGAKAAKKTLTKMRTTLAEAHKETKAEALAFGRKCDAEKNRLLALILEIEDPISEQLDEIKNAEKRKEEERLALIEENLDKIRALTEDRHELETEELEARYKQSQGIEITEDIFQEFTDQAHTLLEDAQMKLRIAINKAKEAAEEAERQAEIARKNQEEADRLAKEREEFEAQQREAREKQEAEDAERRKREQAEQDAKAEELRKQQEEIDRQKAEQEEAERKKAEEEAAAQAEKDRLARAPDAEKLEAFANDLDAAIKAKPMMATQEANNVLLHVCAGLIEIVGELRRMTEELK